MSDAERIVVHFSGHVQGVGFRFTTVRLARRRGDVSGCVRNLADGRVELVGEGERAQLQRLVSDVKSKMGPYIGACDVQWAAATGEFGGFNVAY